MKKLTFILSMLIALIGFNANAGMYICGAPDESIGPNWGLRMTDDGTGVYTYEMYVANNGSDQGYAIFYFVFADSIAQYGDWDTFNNNYRIGPTAGDEVVTVGGEWMTTQKSNGDHGAYKIMAKRGEYYTFTYDSNTSKFNVVRKTHDTQGKIYVCVTGDDDLVPNAGFGLTDDGTGVFSGDMYITNNGSAHGYATYYFVFADDLAYSIDAWDEFNNNYRIGPTGGDETAIVGGEWMTTQKSNGDHGAYKVMLKRDEYYTFTFNTNTAKFSVVRKTYDTQGKIYVCASAENDIYPNAGFSLTDDGTGLFSGDLFVTENGVDQDANYYFLFADALAYSIEDWDTFNNNYRIGPTGGDEAVTMGEWMTSQKTTNPYGAYQITLTRGETYTFIFDTNRSRFMVTPKTAPVTLLSQANALEENEDFTFYGDAVVTLQRGDFVFVRDNSGYGMIYGAVDGSFENGQVLSQGWKATYNSIFGYWPRFIGASDLRASDKTNAELAAAQKLTGAVDESMINAYVYVENVSVGSLLSLPLPDGTRILLTNVIWPTNQPESGNYNVYGIICPVDGQLKFNPITYEKYIDPAGLRGDVNKDGAVNISDVTALIDILLSGAQAPANADCDLDQAVNISDVTALIDFLLGGSWPQAK